jgi:non-ribosomal peptide synthetase component F
VPGLRLFNGYGPTEACVYCAATEMTTTSDVHVIGHPLGVSAWITHPSTTTLAPVGAVGELWVEGPNLARCYYHDEEGTRAAFVQNPTWIPEALDQDGHRVYRTGDLARRYSDGSLSFVGRRGGQIKISGQRVETSEIEFQIQ